MILEAIMTLFISVLTSLISVLPVIEIPIPSGLVGWFEGILTAASMFLPISSMLTILGLDILITNFSIVWKLIMKVWKALPFT